MLILGEPGAGKSTLLYALATYLAQKAERDLTQPLPVILQHSSWAVKQQTLQDWCCEQIAEIYDMPQRVCEQWMQQNMFILLLDGFDEMKENTRTDCIDAINIYHHEHPMPLVVCSRNKEYEEATVRQRLTLQGAVVVRPLTYEVVDTYLAQRGKSLAALQSTLKKNSALRDLATTPLMQDILIRAYQGRSVRSLAKMAVTLQEQVLDDYIRQMIEKKGRSKRYPLEDTRRWLGWLAWQ